MIRRKFVKAAAAGACLLALPTETIALANAPSREKIVTLRIGLGSTQELRLQMTSDRQRGRNNVLPTQPDDYNNYWAEAIEDGDKYYYRAKGTTLEIAEFEFNFVIDNPTLYYFSTALKLHFRIERAKNGVHGA